MHPTETLRMLAVQTWKSRAMKAWFVLTVTILLVNYVFYIWKLLPFAGSSEYLAVHYNVLVGVDRLAPWYWTLMIPGSATAILFTNWLISALLYRRSRPLGLLISIFTVFLEALLLAATIIVILLNVGV